MTISIRFAVLAAVFMAPLGGCQHQPARLETTPAKPSAAPVTPPGSGAASPAGAAGDHGGSVEERLARLEDAYARDAEALAFLNKVYAQQQEQQEQQDHESPAQDAMFAVDIADNLTAGQVDGSPGAPVTIVEAFDFACPYCQRVSSTLEELVTDYKGKVRVVYMNMIIHPSAKPAHLASCAAAKQGKYKEFKQAFWDKGFLPYASSRDEATLGEANILVIAKDLGLDTARFKADMSSSGCQSRIDADTRELSKFHINSTPAFFINGKYLGGALPKPLFQKLIDEQLKIAEASGIAGADYYRNVVFAKGEKSFRSKADPKPN
jgi:protein-disulfide isomerase